MLCRSSTFEIFKSKKCGKMLHFTFSGVVFGSLIIIFNVPQTLIYLELHAAASELRLV